MLIVALSTSSSLATAALMRDGVCILELAADGGKRHAETVLPLVEELMTRTDTPLSAIDLLAVDVGPGSFTGVRIGVSLINAMANALHKPVVGVDALRGIYQSCAADNPRPVCVILNCGNGNGYAGRFLSGMAITLPEAVAVAPYCAALPGGMALITDAQPVQEQPLIPTARFIGQAAYELRGTAAKTAVPLYLRPSQAERMWRARKGGAEDGR